MTTPAPPSGDAEGSHARAQTWEEGSCATDGARIHFLRSGGGGAPVVLLHGLVGSGACWTSLAQALGGEFDVVMPDARGHGRSTAPETGYSYDEHADDVSNLVSRLQLREPVLVGHSMGGMTATVVASRRAPTMRGLVLVDPTFIGPELQREVWESDVVDEHRRALAMSRADLVADARRRKPHRDPEVIEVQVDARLSTRSSAFDVLEPPNPDFRELVRAIAVPTLLVIGDSSLVSAELATELGELNPLLAIEQIPEAGHGLPFDRPQELEGVVTSFLRSLPRTPR